MYVQTWSRLEKAHFKRERPRRNRHCRVSDLAAPPSMRISEPLQDHHSMLTLMMIMIWKFRYRHHLHHHLKNPRHRHRLKHQQEIEIYRSNQHRNNQNKRLHQMLDH
jgi:hypothetical protein